MELLEITKIQILKVIHNCLISANSVLIVVGNHKDTNFESNSQHPTAISILNTVVGNHKDTNFESNSQQVSRTSSSYFCCWKSQRYKF